MGQFRPQNFIWRKDAAYIDGLRPAVEPDGFASEDDPSIKRALTYISRSQNLPSTEFNTLPFAADELLVEDTYYSDGPDLDVPLLRSRIDEYAKGAGEVIGEETGVLPVALSGSVEALWDGDVARLGLRGGFFHPTTGYSLPDAVANALLMTEQRDFSGAALFALFRDRARKLWRERAFFRLLNRMMFRATAPEQRYRVLEHFYRLPEPVIARFYAARLTRLDKVRILTGKPPVPVLKALRAMAA